MKSSRPSFFSAFLLGIFLLGPSCDKPKPEVKAPSQEDYVGNWKVNNPKIGTYFMTLNADGSGSSNLTGGELGRWQWKADHIELEWTPKKMTFYFDSGGSKPQDQPSLQVQDKSIAEKVEQIPSN